MKESAQLTLVTLSSWLTFNFKTSFCVSSCTQFLSFLNHFVGSFLSNYLESVSPSHYVLIPFPFL